MADNSAGRSVMVQGRIVWVGGDLFAGKVKTVFGTQTPRTDAQGKPMMEYGFGLAVPKTELNKPDGIWAAIHEEAFTLFPSRQIPPGFAMKYKDGDGIDDKGVSFAQREGYPGHLVFACTTSLPIKWYKWENGNNVLINEGVKCGDYVNVQLQVKAHGAIGAGKAGLYLNPNAVQFLGYGKEIVNAPSGDQLFGTGMPTIPQGASATPLVPPSFPHQPPPAPAYSAPMPPPQPHYGVVPPAHQPPPGGQPVGNVYPPVGPLPVPGAGATPMAPPTGVPSYAAVVSAGAGGVSPGYPPYRPQ